MALKSYLVPGTGMRYFDTDGTGKREQSSPPSCDTLSSGRAGQHGTKHGKGGRVSSGKLPEK